MVPLPALSQTRAMAVFRLPVAYVRVSGMARGLLGWVEGRTSGGAHHRLDGGREGTRLLRRVGVVGGRVDLELGGHLAAEDALGEHAPDRLLDREDRVAREQVAVA